jgi:hypothetical protein
MQRGILPKLRLYPRLTIIAIFAAVARWKMCESRNFGNMLGVARYGGTKFSVSVNYSEIETIFVSDFFPLFLYAPLKIQRQDL